MTEVAVLGMGAMGSRMAAALLRAGHGVTVWNRSPDRCAPLAAAGARTAPTPRAAVQGVAVALSMVRDDDASRRVWLDPQDGALAGLPEGALAVESSTVSPAWARALAGQCREAGRAFLEAPVSGSLPQAEAGQLVWLVGGDADTLARAEPLLRAMGGAIHHAGPAGSGAVVKLAVNALLAVQVATVAELIGFVRACGGDEARAVAILSATPVCSPAAKGAADLMLTRDTAPRFPVELVEKDLGYALDTATANGTRAPMTDAARRVFAEADAAGLAGANMTGVIRLYVPESSP